MSQKISHVRVRNIHTFVAIRAAGASIGSEPRLGWTVNKFEIHANMAWVEIPKSA